MDETAPGSLPPESSDVMDSVGLTMEAPTIDLPEVIIMPTLTFSAPEEPSTIDSPPVGFYIGEPHASTSEATPHALPEEEGVPGVTLQEILTGESCTDPHTDPGVLSANTRKGKLFKVGLPNGSMGKEDSKVTFQIGRWRKKYYSFPQSRWCRGVREDVAGNGSTFEVHELLQLSCEK